MIRIRRLGLQPVGLSQIFLSLENSQVQVTRGSRQGIQVTLPNTQLVLTNETLALFIIVYNSLGSGSGLFVRLVSFWDFAARFDLRLNLGQTSIIVQPSTGPSLVAGLEGLDIHNQTHGADDQSRFPLSFRLKDLQIALEGNSPLLRPLSLSGTITETIRDDQVEIALLLSVPTLALAISPESLRQLALFLNSLHLPIPLAKSSSTEPRLAPRGVALVKISAEFDFAALLDLELPGAHSLSLALPKLSFAFQVVLSHRSAQFTYLATGTRLLCNQEEVRPLVPPFFCFHLGS